MTDQLYYKGEKIQDLVMEAIKFQDGKLFQEMIALLDTIQALPSTNDKVAAFADGRMTKLVQKYTGLDIYFYTTHQANFSGWKNYNAAIYPPRLTKNNPLFVDLEVAYGWADDEDGKRALRDTKSKTIGTIDLANARVGGAFAELKIRSFVTRDLLVDKNFTSAEKAAIILHEVGHGFTWIEMIAETACFNMAIMTVQRQLMNSSDETKRIELAKAVNECLNVEVDPKTIAKSTKLETWYTVYLKANVEERRKASNSGYYSDTASEFLADQFAVRHGAGQALAGAMTRMFKYYGTDSVSSKMIIWMKTMYEMCRFFGGLVSAVIGVFVAGAAGALGLLIAMFWAATKILCDSNWNIYDWDKARVERMQRELVNRLKDPELDADTKRETLAAIKGIGEMTAKMNEYKSVDQLLAYWFNPKARRNVNLRDMQQEIEKTLNNSLFVSAGNIGMIGQA